MPTKITMNTISHLTRMAITKTKLNRAKRKTSVDEDVETGTPFYTTGQNVTWYKCQGKQVMVPQMVNRTTIIPLLGIYSKTENRN